jgi:hypothetical protein
MPIPLILEDPGDGHRRQCERKHPFQNAEDDVKYMHVSPLALVNAEQVSPQRGKQHDAELGDGGFARDFVSVAVGLEIRGFPGVIHPFTDMREKLFTLAILNQYFHANNFGGTATFSQWANREKRSSA